MIGFLDVAVPMNKTAMDLMRPKKAASQRPAPACSDNHVDKRESDEAQLSYVLTLAASVAATAGSVTSTPTYYKDIAPVMQNRCQECHRPGEVAPMSFMS